MFIHVFYMHFTCILNVFYMYNASCSREPRNFRMAEAKPHNASFIMNTLKTHDSHAQYSHENVQVYPFVAQYHIEWMRHQPAAELMPQAVDELRTLIGAKLQTTTNEKRRKEVMSVQSVLVSADNVSIILNLF